MAVQPSSLASRFWLVWICQTTEIDAVRWHARDLHVK
jgi:hypothetical protein